MESRGHRAREHTADLALELWATDEATLLDEGARALVEVLSEGSAIEARETRPVDVSGVDAEDLLVRFLNEVLVLALLDGFLVSHASLEVRGARVSGTLFGEVARQKLRAEVKSATYHGLSLSRTEAGVRAVVVFDV